MKYLIQTIEKAFVPAILCALVFALLAYGDTRRRRLLAAGCLAGTALALLLALLKQATTLINREWWNMGILGAAIVTGALLAVLILRPAGKRGGILSGISGAAFCGLLLFYTLPDVLLYCAEFAPMGGSLFSTAALLNMAGWLAGLGLAALTGWALYHAAGELPPRMVIPALAGSIVVTLVKYAAAILQVLYARRLIPRSKALFAFLRETVNYGGVFLYAALALTLIIPAALWIRGLRERPSGGNPAERRKCRARARSRRRRGTLIIAGYAAAVFSLTALRSWEQREVNLSPPEPMEIAGEEIIIPFETIADGGLHRFMYQASNGTEVRFIVIQKNAAAWGVGLDACDICGPTGYYQRKDEVICKLCDVVMNKTTIGFKGGCNPVPLAYRVRNAAMVIQTADLESEKGRFK